jgi:hypothetical protein
MGFFIIEVPPPEDVETGCSPVRTDATLLVTRLKVGVLSQPFRRVPYDPTRQPSNTQW